MKSIVDIFHIVFFSMSPIESDWIERLKVVSIFINFLFVIFPCMLFE